MIPARLETPLGNPVAAVSVIEGLRQPVVIVLDCGQYARTFVRAFPPRPILTYVEAFAQTISIADAGQVDPPVTPRRSCAHCGRPAPPHRVFCSFACYESDASRDPETP